MADLLDDRTDEFALREATDMGMPYRDFRNIIMPHCSGLFRFFGGLAMSGMSGTYRTSYEQNLRILTCREPRGGTDRVIATSDEPRSVSLETSFFR